MENLRDPNGLNSMDDIKAQMQPLNAASVSSAFRRARAETFSSFPSKLLQDEPPARTTVRTRSGSLSLPSSSISAAFGPSLFASSWTPANPADSHTVTGNIPASFLSGELADETNLARTLDYLGLDDPLGDGMGNRRQMSAAQAAFNSVPAHHGHMQSHLQYGRAPTPTKIGNVGATLQQPLSDSSSSMGGGRSRSYSVAVGEALSIQIPTVPAATSNRPRASSIAFMESTNSDMLTFESQATLASQMQRKLQDQIKMSWSEPNSPISPHPSDFEKTSDRSPTKDGSAGERSDSPSGHQDHQIPTRSLWIGNVDPTLSPSDLLHLFSPFGAIESLRILPDKECAFVNYVRVEDAIRAKEEMQGGRVGNCIVRVGYGKAEAINDTQGMQPTKSLWVGNIPPTTDPAELEALFYPFGPIESARVLTHKNCGFVNFERLEDAIEARKAMNGKDIGGSVVKIGYAKVPSSKSDSTTIITGERPPGRERSNSTSSVHLMTPPRVSPTSATSGQLFIVGSTASSLVSVSAVSPNTTSAPSIIAASSTETSTVTTGLGLTNRQDGHQTSIGGANGTSLPPGLSMDNAAAFNASPLSRYAGITGSTDDTSKSIGSMGGMGASGISRGVQNAPPSTAGNLTGNLVNSPASGMLMGGPTAAAVVAASGAQHPETLDALTGVVLDGDKYALAIPPLPEPKPNRRVDQNRLREMRKKLEGHATMKDVEALFNETIDEAPDLCTDYIGNVVIQKIIEKSGDQHRLRLIEKVAPHMAAIGIHKNGTWVIQKMIDCAKTTTQIHHVIQALKPFTPPLLLDQFGNYVVQCCLRMGTHRNQFVFDAMHTKCWEIGQGRFGARAMRACLESQYTTKRQQKHVAIAIVQNAVQLCTNPNGAILITWLLDTSSLPGRYRVLAPKLAPHIPTLCTHKLASATILKLVNQRVELDARDIVIREIFFRDDLSLEEILADQVHGVSVIQKILASACVSAEEKIRLADRVRSVLNHMPEVKDNQMGYKRLLDELSVIPTGLSLSGLDHQGGNFSQDIVSPLTPHATFFSGPLPPSAMAFGAAGSYMNGNMPPGTHPTPGHSPQASLYGAPPGGAGAYHISPMQGYGQIHHGPGGMPPYYGGYPSPPQQTGAPQSQLGGGYGGGMGHQQLQHLQYQQQQRSLQTPQQSPQMQSHTTVLNDQLEQLHQQQFQQMQQQQQAHKENQQQQQQNLSNSLNSGATSGGQQFNQSYVNGVGN
ncbi:hypothetical protein HK102_010276 [Quaeritorhiza haematococci]|nr:hypothetical protein HK102_010276 [Quaeritorhiza haematococci]